MKGPLNAPVTIAVFSDYQCPYCEKLFPVIRQVLEKYPKSVRLIVKNFPLPSHKFAPEAAMAAMAAQQQGKFWEFHDKLFESMAALNTKKVQEIARNLHLDMDKFSKDLHNPELQNIINRDIVEGNDAQVGGTPSVFINGKLLKNQTITSLQAKIDEILAKAKQ